MAEDLDLTSIGELQECDSYKWANEYLKLGWLLLSTHLTDYGHPVERHQKTIYCLGWQKSAGESRHPKSEYDHRGQRD